MSTFSLRDDLRIGTSNHTDPHPEGPQNGAQTLTEAPAPSAARPQADTSGYFSPAKQAKILRAARAVIADMDDDGMFGLRAELLYAWTHVQVDATMFHIPQLPTGQKSREYALLDDDEREAVREKARARYERKKEQRV